jgi:hypothetical protein
VLADSKTGATADPVLVDRLSGRRVTEPDYRLVPGPAAGEQMRRRLDFASRRQESQSDEGSKSEVGRTP